MFYNNLNDDYILLNNEPIDASYIDRIKSYAEERLEVSKSIIVHDLISRKDEIMGKDEQSEKSN